MDTNLLFVKCFLCQSTFDRWRSKAGLPPPHLLNDFYKFVREVSNGGELGNLNDCEILSICTCEDCAALIKSAMDEKIFVDEEEARVRKLQLELLANLNKLQRRLIILSEKMRLVEGRVTPQDCDVILIPEPTVQILTAGGKDAKIYRDGIANAVSNLTIFQENVGMRVGVNTGKFKEEEDAFKSDPYSAASDTEIKNESDEEVIILEWEQNAARVDGLGGAEVRCGKFNSKMQKTASKRRASQKVSCKLCGKILAKRYLSRHMTLVHGGKYKCPTCDKKCSSREVLQRHMDRKHLSQEKKIPCQQCRRSFLNDAALSAHLVNVHGQEPTKLPTAMALYKCKVCGKQCASMKGLRHHRHMHLTPEERKQTVCPHCNKTFYVKSLEHHISHLCEGVPRQVVCAQCGKSFASHTKLRDHTYRVHKLDNLTCQLCGKEGLKNRTALKIHMARHSAKRDFICELCGGGFKIKVDLTKHKYKCDGSKKPKMRRSTIIIDNDNLERNK